MTALVLSIVLLTKFLAGAWIAILAMIVLLHDDAGIRRHYDRVGRELAGRRRATVLPTRVHAIVLVSKLHKPTLRALAYAKATRPNMLEAVYVDVDDEVTSKLLRGVGRSAASTSAEGARTRRTARSSGRSSTTHRDPEANPRDVVAVYIPEYVVGRWWEQLLHNQTALRLKGRLLFTPGVMVTSVPYQLRVLGDRPSERAERRVAGVRPGDVRRGRRARARSRDRSAGAGADRRRRGRGGRSRVGRAVERGRADRARRPLRRTDEGRVVFVRHALRASGCVVVSPRARRRASCVATPSRCSGLAGPRRRRPARTPGRAAAAAATSSTSSLAAQRALKADGRRASSCPAGRARRATSRSRRSPATTTASAGAPGCSRVTPDRRPRAAPAPLPRRRAGRPLPDRTSATAVAADEWPRRGSSDRRRRPAGERVVVPTPATDTTVTRVADGAAARLAVAGGSGRCTRAPPRCWSTAVLELCAPQPGESVLDLYAGVGLFAAFLADAVGPTGPVVAVEGDRGAARTPRRTCADLPQVHGRRTAASTGCWPRRQSRSTWSCSTRRATGAGREVVERDRRPAAAGGRLRRLRPRRPGPRPRHFAEHGYALTALRAFDLFPMTHHVECVALLAPAQPDHVS